MEGDDLEQIGSLLVLGLAVPTTLEQLFARDLVEEIALDKSELSSKLQRRDVNDEQWLRFCGEECGRNTADLLQANVSQQSTKKATQGTTHWTVSDVVELEVKLLERGVENTLGVLLDKFDEHITHV